MTVVTDVTTVVIVVTGVTYVTLVILMTDAITKLDEVAPLLPDPSPANSTRDNDTLHLSDIGQPCFCFVQTNLEDPHFVTQLVMMVFV